MICQTLYYNLYLFPKKVILDFFAHIKTNTRRRTYFKGLPSPYRANRVSKGLRHFFEKKWIRRLFGANLGAAMMVAPLLQLNQSPVVYEPRLEIPSSYISEASIYEIPVTTEPRKFITPVDNLKYMGQGYHQGHAAYDLNAKIGSNVRAFTSGRVSYLENGQFGYGRYLILDHGQELYSVYAHLNDFTVTQNQTVETGEVIGHVGMTGWTTGPHLHFEIHESGTAINPKKYLGF